MRTTTLFSWWGDDGIHDTGIFDLYAWIAAQGRETYALLIEYRWTEAKPGFHVGVMQAAGVILERTTTGGLVKKTHFMFYGVHNVVDLEVMEDPD